MTKNADFGPNLAVFGPKILIFIGVSKSFGTNITQAPSKSNPEFSKWKRSAVNESGSGRSGDGHP